MVRAGFNACLSAKNQISVAANTLHSRRSRDVIAALSEYITLCVFAMAQRERPIFGVPVSMKSIRIAIAASLTALYSPVYAQAVTFLDLSGGLTGWTTAGTVSILTGTDAFDINGNSYSLTPAGAASGSVDALLGLGANSIESLLNNSNGSVTNFGVMTQSYSFTPGTYTFSWAYAATDYQPYNDGVLFSVVGGGSQTLVSLARNGSSSTDTSGPSPGTLILGSYGTLPWQT